VLQLFILDHITIRLLLLRLRFWNLLCWNCRRLLRRLRLDCLERLLVSFGLVLR